MIIWRDNQNALLSSSSITAASDVKVMTALTEVYNLMKDSVRLQAETINRKRELSPTNPA